MNVLIIGYGSIGKRHESVLEEFNEVSNIDIVTKQIINNKTTFRCLEDIPYLEEYDYFIISTKTIKHYEQLVFLESKVSNKIFFCEKPLFETKRKCLIKKNSIYVGYVLRFHPLLEQLSVELKNQKVINVNVNCGQYLPTWRSDIDYFESYSSKKDEGGGVLLDLSHEIDYIQWLFGKLETIKSLQLKISDLKIDSDDITTLIGKTDQDVIVNLSIDYINKITYRKILINTIDNSYELDFIANYLRKKDKYNNENIIKCDNLERNDMFKSMHKSILTDKNNICKFDEALSVMDTIYKIQEQNK